MVMVYRYIAENAAFYRIILGENGIPFLVNRFRKYLSELTIQRFRLLTTPEGQRAGSIGDCGRICCRVNYRIDQLVAGK